MLCNAVCCGVVQGHFVLHGLQRVSMQYLVGCMQPKPMSFSVRNVLNN